MMRRMPLLIAALLAGTAMMPVFAQVNPELARALSEPQEQSMIIGAAKHSNVVNENACSESRYSIANQFSIYEPPRWVS